METRTDFITQLILNGNTTAGLFNHGALNLCSDLTKRHIRVHVEPRPFSLCSFMSCMACKGNRTGRPPWLCHVYICVQMVTCAVIGKRHRTNKEKKKNLLQREILTYSSLFQASYMQNRSSSTVTKRQINMSDAYFHSHSIISLILRSPIQALTTYTVMIVCRDLWRSRI